MQTTFANLSKINPLSYQIILLYGSDPADLMRASRYIIQLFKKAGYNLLYQASSKTSTQNKVSSQTLFDPPNTKNLFIIEDIGETFFSSFQPNEKDYYLLLTTKLKSKSSSIQKISILPIGLTISCYENPLTLFEVENYTSEYSLPREIIQHIHKQFYTNYLGFFNFLQYLYIYSDSLSDFIKKGLNIFLEEQNTEYEQYCFYFLKRDLKILSSLPQLIKEIHFIRFLIRYLMLLAELKSLLSSGIRSQDLFTQCSQTVFFKHQPIIKECLQKWTKDDIFYTLKQLQFIETQIKSNAQVDLKPLLFFLPGHS